MYEHKNLFLNGKLSQLTVFLSKYNNKIALLQYFLFVNVSFIDNITLLKHRNHFGQRMIQ